MVRAFLPPQQKLKQRRRWWINSIRAGPSWMKNRAEERPQSSDKKSTAKFRIARGFRHRWTVPESADKTRVRDKAGGAPASKTCKGASHIGIQSQKLLFVRVRTHPYSIWRVEAEDARLHIARTRQHAMNVLRRQQTDVLLAITIDFSCAEPVRRAARGGFPRWREFARGRYRERECGARCPGKRSGVSLRRSSNAGR